MRKYVFGFILLMMAGFTLSAQTVEAENGVLTGTAVGTSRAGFSGTGYVTGFDNAGDAVAINVIAAETGLYKLSLRYASPFGDKFNIVLINNENAGSVMFAETATFKNAVAGKVRLNKGVNTIKVVHDWGYIDIDYISLEPAAPAPFKNVAAALVTPNPSTEADSLYRMLKKNYGQNILSGQYGGATEFDYILNKSGKKPAIRGFDLIDYSPSRIAFGASSTETEKAIAWAESGGWVTFCWHWNAPKDLINQEPDKQWWRGFYTVATNFDVTLAMNNSESEAYQLIIRDVDAIAVQLKRLQAENIPVLWRPLHEAEGAWFWWGAKGPEACKWLWKLVFDRLVNHHALNNLIWVWTSTDKPSALDWYPGDAYVDMIGADVYLAAGNYSTNFLMFDNMATLFGGNKILALSETGTIPDPGDLEEQKAAWSWFATWSGDFITDGVYNSPDHVSEVFKHDYVITFDELDDYSTALPDPDVVLGIDEENSFQINVYPNPVIQNRIVLEVAEHHRVSAVQLYNQQGKLTREKSQLENMRSISLDMEQEAPGIYYLKIFTGHVVKVIKLIRR
jgi:mannan endo-1,4-beta-mannosidase